MFFVVNVCSPKRKCARKGNVIYERLKNINLAAQTDPVTSVKYDHVFKNKTPTGNENINTGSTVLFFQ